MPKESFEVNILDKQDIRSKLPELQALIEQKRKELADLAARYEQLRTWAGYPTRSKVKPGSVRALSESLDPARPPGSVDEVVEIVERIGRPMRSREVVVEMGPDAKRDTASWALWEAERRGRLKRFGTGLYGPLTYEPSENGSESKE
jgi:hypothetical protein